MNMATSEDFLENINPAFLEEVEGGSGVKVSACFQCRKCTNGCPVTFAMDLYPDQVMRYIQLGIREPVLNSSTIWVCASCETCTTRCPPRCGARSEPVYYTFHRGASHWRHGGGPPFLKSLLVFVDRGAENAS